MVAAPDIEKALANLRKCLDRRHRRVADGADPLHAVFWTLGAWEPLELRDAARHDSNVLVQHLPLIAVVTTLLYVLAFAADASAQ